jgi:hypothetical protein
MITDMIMRCSRCGIKFYPVGGGNGMGSTIRAFGAEAGTWGLAVKKFNSDCEIEPKSYNARLFYYYDKDTTAIYFTSGGEIEKWRENNTSLNAYHATTPGANSRSSQ